FPLSRRDVLVPRLARARVDPASTESTTHRPCRCTLRARNGAVLRNNLVGPCGRDGGARGKTRRTLARSDLLVHPQPAPRRAVRDLAWIPLGLGPWMPPRRRHACLRRGRSAPSRQRAAAADGSVALRARRLSLPGARPLLSRPTDRGSRQVLSLPAGVA